jgi:hypothetical protein
LKKNDLGYASPVNPFCTIPLANFYARQRKIRGSFIDISMWMTPEKTILVVGRMWRVQSKAFTPFVYLQPKLGAGSPDWVMSQDVDALLSCSIDSIVLSTSGLEWGIPALHKNR